MLAAMRTVIAPFPIMKKSLFAHKRKVFNDGSTIIMDLICQPVAMRAGRNFARKRKVDMDFGIRRS